MMLVAMRESTTLKYMHQDHLSSTSVMTDTNGDSLGAIKYLPYGETRSGSVPTDKQFTGQRLDGTGLYYYNARYYDPIIGRFISADPLILRAWNPQSFNRYSYCLNNPLKYIDPSGYDVYLASGWNVEAIRAMWQPGINYYIPSGYWEEVSDIVNSPEYQAYSQLREDEAAQAEDMEKDDTVWIVSCTIEAAEDEHDGQFNSMMLFNIGVGGNIDDVHRYRWNADPAWWGDPEWQRDWGYQIGRVYEQNKVYIAAGVFIVGTLITVGGGAAALVMLFPAEVAAYTIAPGIAYGALTVGGASVSWSIDMLTDGEYHIPTEAIPPGPWYP